MVYVVVWDGSEWRTGEALVYGAFHTFEAARKRAEQVVCTHVGKWETNDKWVGNYGPEVRVCRVLCLNVQTGAEWHHTLEAAPLGAGHQPGDDMHTLTMWYAIDENGDYGYHPDSAAEAVDHYRETVQEPCGAMRVVCTRIKITLPVAVELTGEVGPESVAGATLTVA